MPSRLVSLFKCIDLSINQFICTFEFFYKSSFSAIVNLAAAFWSNIFRCNILLHRILHEEPVCLFISLWFWWIACFCNTGTHSYMIKSLYFPLIQIQIYHLSISSFIICIFFIQQAPVNFITLHCVRPPMRPLSMAISTVAIHIFGDVPSSPLLGVLQVSFHSLYLIIQ